MSLEDLPQNVIDKMSEQDRRDMGLRSTEEQMHDRIKGAQKHEDKAERDIQNQVESWLVINGFERRTPDSIARGRPGAGYFIHLHETKRNPIILDLLILSNTGRYMELELKTATGTLTAEQECLVNQGGRLARSAKEAIDIIKAWCDAPGIGVTIEEI